MKKEISEKEWELIEALRNFRNSKHNPSKELELWADMLYEQLKESN